MKLQYETSEVGHSMGRKRIPVDRPPSLRGRSGRARDASRGYGYLTAAFLLPWGHRPPVTSPPGEPAGEAAARAPPAANVDRAGGWIHRPESPDKSP
jgi:hypothetical protein